MTDENVVQTLARWCTFSGEKCGWVVEEYGEMARGRVKREGKGVAYWVLAKLVEEGEVEHRQLKKDAPEELVAVARRKHEGAMEKIAKSMPAGAFDAIMQLNKGFKAVAGPAARREDEEREREAKKKVEEVFCE